MNQEQNLKDLTRETEFQDEILIDLPRDTVFLDINNDAEIFNSQELVFQTIKKKFQENLFNASIAILWVRSTLRTKSASASNAA